MKNKVLLVSPYLKNTVGGIGTWTKNILDYNKKYGEFDIVFLNTAFGFKSNLVKNTGQRLISGVLDSLLILILLFIKVIKYKPRAIHYTSSASYALIKDFFAICIAKLFRIKFIIHWRCGRIPELFEKQNLEWKMLKIVIRAADVSIVLDNSTLKCLKNIGTKKIVLIPNPISEYLHEKAKSVSFENKSIKIGTLIFIGHVIPTKGVFELVEACSKIEGIVQLVLIGPFLPKIKNDLMSVALGRKNPDWLVWKGEILREEVFKYLYSANAICLPSYTEGFPNVIIEAMAMGCPVIATNVGAIEEILLSEGFDKAGICISPRDINQLTKAIEFMISNPAMAKEFGKNGNQRVLARYTPNHILHQYETIWREVH